MVKKSLHLTPGIEPLYGTRDENLRLMEDGLKVQIDLRADSIQLMGEAMAVARVEGIFSDFEHLRKLGVHPHNGELNALLKMVVSDPTVTLRGLVESGKQRAMSRIGAVCDWCRSWRCRVDVIPPASKNREKASYLLLQSPDGGQATLW